MKVPFLAVSCAALILSGCDSKQADQLAAEKEKLDAERKVLAAEKQRMAEEQLASQKAANAVEADRLADERAKLAEEKERLAREQKKEEKAANEQNAQADARAAEEKAELEITAARAAEDRRHAEALKVKAEADRAAADRAAAETKAREAAAAVEAASKHSISIFFDALASDGDWFQTDRYGFAWRPKRSALDPDWRPYTDGRWHWTDYGWTWQSQESYGWAVYHYGRWLRQPGVGWLWIPGQDWAPAWVAWRVKGSEFVGWAPLPPESKGSRGYGSMVDRELEIAPVNYVFVATADFDQPNYLEHLVTRDRQMEMLRGSRNVTRLEPRQAYDGGVMVAGGPDRGAIASVIRELRNDPDAKPIPQLNLVRSGMESDKRADTVEAGTLMLYAPRLEKAAPTAKPKTVQENVKVNERENGWSDTSPAQEAEWRAMMDRDAAIAAAAAAAAKMPQRPTQVVPTPTPTPTPRPRQATPPPKPNPLNPSRLEPTRGLFSK